jgi:hypothetical protein
MMVPKKSLILAGAALALLGASSSAQSQSGKVFARYNKPLSSVALDLESGTITHGPKVQDKKVVTCAHFNNADLGGFVGVDTGNKFCEWFDAGTKKVGACPPTTNNLMRSILFAYCSSSQAVGSGGPGGTAKLGFYEGYTVGGGAPTTAIAVFTLTGLPANTASSSFFGGFRCYFIRITFNPVINWDKPTGRLGYSWAFLDTGRDGVLAATWPFLSCVQSCSGTGPDHTGMVDLIDEYCPVGTLRATFSFGTTSVGSYFTSISMQVEKLVPNDCLVCQVQGDNAGCNVCEWKLVPHAAPVPATQKYVCGNAGSAPQAACLGGSWGPQVQLNAKGAHASPPAPLGGVHGASGFCKYRVYLGQPNNGPCPGVVFNDLPPAPLFAYSARVELGPNTTVLAKDINGTIAAGMTNIPLQQIPKDIAFACVEWVCYANIQTTQLRCRSKYLFGTVGI